MKMAVARTTSSSAQITMTAIEATGRELVEGSNTYRNIES